MKWDFAIGNPPYQNSLESYNRQEPVYPHFYDAATEIAESYLLITPARFLFNAGLTPKEWNRKMLSDEHLKVEYYNQNAAEVFPNTDIKGGVAVVYRNANESFGAIDEFVQDETLRKIVEKFKAIKESGENLSSQIYGGRSDLKFNHRFIEEYPKSKEDRLAAIKKKHPNANQLAQNEEYELKSSTFDVLPYVFLAQEPKHRESYYKILGLFGGKRTYRWISREFMIPRYPDNNNIDAYKTFIPSASGNGQFGEPLSALVVGEQGTSATPTFLSVGRFKTVNEAENVAKYIKTKFVRTLFSVKKVTQHITPNSWVYVPLQDFTDKSDINWNTSIADIDQQLYKKYGLSQEEIDFIETHVKEMA